MITRMIISKVRGNYEEREFHDDGSGERVGK